MAENKPPVATPSIPSGKNTKVFASTTLGGYPPSKSVEEIEKVNRVKNAPNSAST